MTTEPKLLAVIQHIEYPNAKGVVSQTLTMLGEMAGHTNVHLYALVKKGITADAEEIAQNYGFKSVFLQRLQTDSIFSIKKPKSYLKATIELYKQIKTDIEPKDHIFIQGLSLAPLLASNLLKKRASFSFIDCQSRRNKYLILHGPLHTRLVAILKYAVSSLTEPLIQTLSKKTHVYSQEDLLALPLKQQCPTYTIGLIPPKTNSLETMRKPYHGGPLKIAIYGNMAVPYIKNGAKEILVSLLKLKSESPKRIDSITLLGVGALPPENAPFKEEGITYHQWVDNIPRFLADQHLVFLPDKSGSGVRNRIFDIILANGLVAGFPPALEGLPLQNKINCFVLDNETTADLLVKEIYCNPSIVIPIANSCSLLIRQEAREKTISDWENFLLT